MSACVIMCACRCLRVHYLLALSNVGICACIYIIYICNMYAGIQKIITRKLELFGHICRMENDRKIKSIVFGRLDGTNKRGRPHTEWMDNITDWCGASIQELYHAALEKQKW